MRALLDTHAFLWWINDDGLLSPRARQVIGNGDNELLFSAASGWEMAIKIGLGKLALTQELERFMAEQLTINSIQTLPVQLSHALRVASMPPYHRDPFDRLLVAQAQMEDLPIITGDPQIARYQVAVIW